MNGEHETRGEYGERTKARTRLGEKIGLADELEDGIVALDEARGVDDGVRIGSCNDDDKEVKMEERENARKTGLAETL